MSDTSKLLAKFTGKVTESEALEAFEVFRDSEAREKVLEIIRGGGGEGATSLSIMEATELSAEELLTFLGAGVTCGKLIREGEGVGTRYRLS